MRDQKGIDAAVEALGPSVIAAGEKVSRLSDDDRVRATIQAVEVLIGRSMTPEERRAVLLDQAEDSDRMAAAFRRAALGPQLRIVKPAEGD